MAISTFTNFATKLAALATTGVVKKLAHPPTSLDTADLPASWIQMPEGEEGQITFGNEGGWPTMAIEYCVAITPVAQGTQATAFAAAISMMDAISDAFRALGMNEMVKTGLAWTIRATVFTVAGTDYWGVLVTVTGRG